MQKRNGFKAKDVMARTGFHRRRLKLWEEYGILSPDRERSGNKDRIYTESDVKKILWAVGLMKKGLSIDAVKILKEYFETGEITSYKGYR